MGHQTHLGPERGFRRVVRRSGLAGPRGPSAAAPTQRVCGRPSANTCRHAMCAPGEALVCKQETEEQRNRRGPRPKAFCLLLCPLTSGSSHLVAGLPVHPEVGALNVRGDLTCTHAPGTPGVCQGKARQGKARQAAGSEHDAPMCPCAPEGPARLLVRDCSARPGTCAHRRSPAAPSRQQAAPSPCGAVCPNDSCQEACLSRSRSNGKDTAAREEQRALRRPIICTAASLRQLGMSVLY